MKILFICDEFPPGKTGGIGIITSLLAKNMALQGHQIFIVGLCTPGYGGLDYEENENIKIWRFRYAMDVGIISAKENFKDKVLTQVFRKTGMLKMDARVQFNKMWKFIEALIDEQKIDVVEMPDWNNFFFNITFNDFKIPPLAVPLVVKMHGSLSVINDARGLSRNEDIYRKENYLYKRADAISAVSGYVAKQCAVLHHLKNNIKTLYNGVEIKDFYGVEVRANKNEVIFSGSLLYNKGIYSLMQAWPAVLAKVPNASLHVYGKGPLQSILKMLEPSIRNTVFFYGHVERTSLLKVLQTADLAVFPSYSEAFGLGPVEAMSVGCPVIFTKRSVGPEIVEDRVNGLNVDPDNINEISDSIILLLNDRQLRGSLGLKGYDTVKSKFNIDEICQQHIQYYKDVIADWRKKL